MRRDVRLWGMPREEKSMPTTVAACQCPFGISDAELAGRAANGNYLEVMCDGQD